MTDSEPLSHAAFDWVTVEHWAPLTEPHQVYWWLSQLKPKATGSDKMPTRLYKEVLFLSEPISHPFNSCILEGIMPDSWKLADIPNTFKIA